MPFYVYILQSETTGRLYIGQSSRKDERYFEHTHGQAKSTRNRGPWKRVYLREFATRSEAVRHERWLKSLKSRRYILEHVAAR